MFCILSLFYPKWKFLTLNHLFLMPNPVPFSAEFWGLHKELPTVDEIVNVYAALDEPELAEDASEDNKKKRERKLKVLIWYLDEYMPKMASVTYWGPTIRPYKLMTDKMKIEGHTGVLVTSSTEAFALLQYENSRKKWIEIFKWKDANGWRKTAPQYSSKKPETAPFKSKWSEAKNGQGSGWDPIALATFNQRQDAIKEWRAKDKAEDYKRMKDCQSLIKAANEIKADQTEPSRKRRRTVVAEATAADDDDQTVIELDFEEDED